MISGKGIASTFPWLEGLPGLDTVKTRLPGEQVLLSLEKGPAPFIKESIQALFRTLADRDPYTGQHSARVTEVAVGFARSLGLASWDLDVLKTAVYLHDIGKIGISDAILQKPGPLTPEERAIITTHPLIGEKIVEPLNLKPKERQIILFHHERWDGGGYPQGLKGTQIPLLCRLAALADVFDALTTDRPYRRRFSVGEALAEIAAQGGSQFDPELTRQFVDFIVMARSSAFPPAPLQQAGEQAF